MNPDKAIQMLNANDSAVMALPSPIRMRLAQIPSMLRDMVGEQGMNELISMMQQGFSQEVVLNFCRDNPAIAALISESPGMAGAPNYGALDTFLAPLRYEANGSPHIQTSDNFEIMLTHTELGRDVLCRDLCLGYGSFLFVEFGEARRSDLWVYNRETGNHILEGAYITESYIEAGHFMLTHHPGRSEGLGLSPGKPTRIIELLFTGSPLGKSNSLDDATQRIPLFIQDEDEPLSQLLVRHYSYFSREEAFSMPGAVVMSEDEIDSTTANIDHLCKALIILARTPELESRAEYADLEARIAKLGPKKAAKQKRKQLLAYDRRILRPSAELDAKLNNTQGLGRRSHWRAGHFRNQPCGPQKMDRKLIYIEATFVTGSSENQTE